MRLDLVAAFNDGSRWVYEIKSLALCLSLVRGDVYKRQFYL